MLKQQLLAFASVAISGIAARPAALVAHSDSITVTISYDNYAYTEGFETGWGFAALIETDDGNILFDTGTRGDMFLRNSRALGKHTEDVDALVFSHSHRDHTGGIEAALFGTGVKPPTFLLSAFPADLRDRVPDATTIIEAEPGDEMLVGIFSTGQVGEEISGARAAVPVGGFEGVDQQGIRMLPCDFRSIFVHAPRSFLPAAFR